MKRFVFLFVAALSIAALAGACASMQQGGLDLVTRAVQASGGPLALGGVKTIAQKGVVKQWEPEQSAAAGGEMRFANESSLDAVTDVASRTTRTDWVRNYQYPAPRTYTFSEIVSPEAGYVAGIDSSGRTKQSVESNPPAHTMSALRMAAVQRELLRNSPLLVLEMQKNPASLAATGDITVGGVTYPAVNYLAGDQTLTVMFDRATGLPARIRTLDYDNIWGDVTYDLVLSDWQTVDGVRIATSRKYELNGRTVADTKITETRINAPLAADRLVIPAAFLAGARGPATGDVPYQWVIRRQFIGTYLDSDQPSYDTKGSTGLRFVELGPGVQHQVGGTHHSLVVEMKDHVVVFDAPVSDWHANWVLSAVRAKYLRKPVKYVVLTHHHMDHTGGIRAYASEGATIVTGKGTAEHWKRVLAAPYTRNPNLAPRDLTRTPIIEVAEKWVHSDGQREVHAYVIAPNPHAEGLMIGYVPDLKLGFATDIWSPGAGALPDRLNPALAALVAGVKKAGITPVKFAGGHGSTADYAPLAALEGK
jgi:glyoxylase-like metal-dependent hydrolase (beta-lactamase superfamily II)